MNILVTGARGFIGRNLVSNLENIRDGKDRTYFLGFNSEEMNILQYDVDSDPALLWKYCRQADFVYNLAGVNRPNEQSQFVIGNVDFVSMLLGYLKKAGNRAPVMCSSSIQAELNNPYGLSKKKAEDILFQYSNETGVSVYVYRFPNVFGKWCMPNYNSAVATFCYNIANDLPIVVNDRSIMMTLVYIDDLVAEIINCLAGKANVVNGYGKVACEYHVTLGRITDLVYSFKGYRNAEGDRRLMVPDMSDLFTKKLYAMYLSYLPVDQFSYNLKMNRDQRGSFTEIIRTLDCGQLSVNVSKPGVSKGNHWHNTKCEKFLVVKGEGMICFRKVGTSQDAAKSSIIEYPVSGEKLQFVDIPPGYTHKIINLGTDDMVTVMWASEPFDLANPDTFHEEV